MARPKKRDLHRLEQGWDNHIIHPIHFEIKQGSYSPLGRRKFAPLLPSLGSFEDAGNPSYLEYRKRSLTERLDPPSTYNSISSTFGFSHHSGTDHNAELKVIKYILMREGLVMKLSHLCEKLSKGKISSSTQQFDSELLDTLAQVRDVTVNYVEMLCYWRESAADFDPHNPRVFSWEGTNYTMKIINDLDFLADNAQLVQSLQLAPAKMRANPLMLANTLEEGDTWIDPSERAVYDAGGLSEGPLFDERYRIRIAERVLLQEIECNLLRQPMPAWDDSHDREDVSKTVKGAGEIFAINDDTEDGVPQSGDPLLSEEEELRKQQLITWHLEAHLQLKKIDTHLGEKLLSIGTSRLDRIQPMSARVPGTPKFHHESPWQAEPTKLTQLTSPASAADIVPIVKQLMDTTRPNTSSSQALKSSLTARSSSSSRAAKLSYSASREIGRSRSAASDLYLGPPPPVLPENALEEESEELLHIPDRTMNEYHSQGVDCLQLDENGTKAGDAALEIFSNVRQPASFRGSPTQGSPGRDAPQSTRSHEAASKTVEAEPSVVSRATTASSLRSSTNSLRSAIIEVMTPYEIERIMGLETPPQRLQLAIAACVVLLSRPIGTDDVPKDVSFDAFKKLGQKIDVSATMNTINPKTVPNYKVRAIAPFLPQLEAVDEFPESSLTLQEIVIANKLCRWVAELVRVAHKNILRIEKRRNDPVNIAAAAVHVSRSNRPLGMLKGSAYAKEVNIVGISSHLSCGGSPTPSNGSVSSKSFHIPGDPLPMSHLPPIRSVKPKSLLAKANIKVKAKSQSISTQKNSEPPRQRRKRCASLSAASARDDSSAQAAERKVEGRSDLWPVHTEIIQNMHPHPLLLTLLSTKPSTSADENLPSWLAEPIAEQEQRFVAKIYDLVDSREALAPINMRQHIQFLHELRDRHQFRGDVGKYFQPIVADWWVKNLPRVIIVRERGDGSLLLVVSKKLIEQVVLHDMSRPPADGPREVRAQAAQDIGDKAGDTSLGVSRQPSQRSLGLYQRVVIADERNFGVPLPKKEVPIVTETVVVECREDVVKDVAKKAPMTTVATAASTNTRVSAAGVASKTPPSVAADGRKASVTDAAPKKAAGTAIAAAKQLKKVIPPTEKAPSPVAAQSAITTKNNGPRSGPGLQEGAPSSGKAVNVTRVKSRESSADVRQAKPSSSSAKEAKQKPTASAAPISVVAKKEASKAKLQQPVQANAVKGDGVKSTKAVRPPATKIVKSGMVPTAPPPIPPSGALPESPSQLADESIGPEVEANASQTSDAVAAEPEGKELITASHDHAEDIEQAQVLPAEVFEEENAQVRRRKSLERLEQIQKEVEATLLMANVTDDEESSVERELPNAGAQGVADASFSSAAHDMSYNQLLTAVLDKDTLGRRTSQQLTENNNGDIRASLSSSTSVMPTGPLASIETPEQYPCDAKPDESVYVDVVAESDAANERNDYSQDDTYEDDFAPSSPVADSKVAYVSLDTVEQRHVDCDISPRLAPTDGAHGDMSSNCEEASTGSREIGENDSAKAATKEDVNDDTAAEEQSGMVMSTGNLNYNGDIVETPGNGVECDEGEYNCYDDDFEGSPRSDILKPEIQDAFSSDRGTGYDEDEFCTPAADAPSKNESPESRTAAMDRFEGPPSQSPDEVFVAAAEDDFVPFSNVHTTSIEDVEGLHEEKKKDEHEIAQHKDENEDDDDYYDDNFDDDN